MSLLIFGVDMSVPGTIHQVLPMPPEAKLIRMSPWAMGGDIEISGRPSLAAYGDRTGYEIIILVRFVSESATEEDFYLELDEFDSLKGITSRLILDINDDGDYLTWVECTLVSLRQLSTPVPNVLSDQGGFWSMLELRFMTLTGDPPS